MPSPEFSCGAFMQHLSAWRDQQPGAPADQMQTHLLSCGRCAALYRALEVGVRVLRATEIPPSVRLSGH